MLPWSPKKFYKDTLKVSLKSCDTISDTREKAAQGFATWHPLINTGMTAYEEGGVNEAIQKHQQQKTQSKQHLSVLPHPGPEVSPVEQNHCDMDWTNQPHLHQNHHDLSVILSHGHLQYQRMNITTYLFRW